ncbi:MAG: hypothetical protein WAL98_12405 [Desulfatiglandaceae bacterium]|jgi:hypothetical protein
MNNEVEPYLTIFFRRFLNTPEEMDAYRVAIARGRDVVLNPP